MEATSKFDDTLERLVHRTRGGAIVSLAGVTIMLITLIFTSIRLAFYSNEVSRYVTEIREKSAQLAEIEHRKAAALFTVQELQAQIQLSRTVIAEMTAKAERSQQIPPALIAKAQDTLRTNTTAVERAALAVPTIGIVIATEAQREPAAKLRDAIIAKGFKVDYIRSVGTKGKPPTNTEVRYFRSPQDAAQAGELRDMLETAFGIADARGAYVIDPDTPGNTYEIWLASNALVPPPTPPTQTSTNTSTT